MNAPVRPIPAKPAPAVEPLLSKRDVAAALGCEIRTVERLASAGRFPRPDVRVGRLPRWKAETIRRWIDQGGES